jgi:hypothetical protein
MSFGGRLSIVIGLFVVAAGFAVWGVLGFLLTGPPTVDFTSAQPAGAPVNLTVQTVGSIGNGYGDHPTWVSYLVENPQGQWIHSTIWQVPAHTRINLTIEQFDSGSPLRNQQWGLVHRTRRHLQRQDVLRLQLEHRQRGRAHVRHPHPWHQHPADRRLAQRQQRVQSGPVFGPQLGHEHHQSLLRDARPG